MNNESLDVLTTGLAKMEACLDRCATSPGDSIENKVQILFFDPVKDIPTDESFKWLGRAVLETKALQRSLESEPDKTDQKITEFLNAWGAETDAPAWAGKSTIEKLHQLIELFCAGLEGFCDGFADQAEMEK